VQDHLPQHLARWFGSRRRLEPGCEVSRKVNAVRLATFKGVRDVHASIFLRRARFSCSSRPIHAWKSC
jgi:hypothetical protein